MRLIFLSLLLLSGLCHAQTTTYTTNYQYAKPGDGATSWGTDIRSNWDKADAQFKTLENAVSSWTKYTLVFSDFSDASTSKQVTIANVPAGSIAEAVLVNHTAAFTGGAISAYTVDVDLGSTSLESVVNVFLAPTTSATGEPVYDVENFTSPAALTVTANSVGANLDQATTGSVDVYVKITTLP